MQKGGGAAAAAAAAMETEIQTSAAPPNLPYKIQHHDVYPRFQSFADLFLKLGDWSLKQPALPPPPRLNFDGCNDLAVRGRLLRSLPTTQLSGCEVTPELAPLSPLGSRSDNDSAACNLPRAPTTAVSSASDFLVGSTNTLPAPTENWKELADSNLEPESSIEAHKLPDENRQRLVIQQSISVEWGRDAISNGEKSGDQVGDGVGNVADMDGDDEKHCDQIEHTKEELQLEEGEVSGGWVGQERSEDLISSQVSNGEIVEMEKDLHDAYLGVGQQAPVEWCVGGFGKTMGVCSVASYPRYYTRSSLRKGKADGQDCQGLFADFAEKQNKNKKGRGKRKKAKQKKQQKISDKSRDKCNQQAGKVDRKGNGKHVSKVQRQTRERIDNGQEQKIIVEGKQDLAKVKAHASSREPEEGEVVPIPEKKKGFLSSLVEDEVGLWSTDVGDDQILITQGGLVSEKQRAPMTAERKKARQRAKHIKRAEKEKALGIRRLRLKPPEKKITPLCQFYIKGKCNKGEKCTFSHDAIPQTKSEICKFYVNHCCLKGDDCPFSHDLSTFPCKYFHTRGFCLDGNECRFSHEMVSMGILSSIEAGIDAVQSGESLKIVNDDSEKDTSSRWVNEGSNRDKDDNAVLLAVARVASSVTATTSVHEGTSLSSRTVETSVTQIGFTGQPKDTESEAAQCSDLLSFSAAAEGSCPGSTCRLSALELLQSVSQVQDQKGKYLGSTLRLEGLHNSRSITNVPQNLFRGPLGTPNSGRRASVECLLNQALME